MKRFTLISLLLFILSLKGFSTVWTVTFSGTTFTPNSIIITAGDSVNFVLSGAHNAVEVSQTTWNANGTTALAGGFSVAFGGGFVLPSKLPAGVHYYVCTNHASMGMKGTITVNPCITTLNLKFFIQGYYSGGGMMQKVLFNEGVDGNSLSTNVDTVLVELHHAVNPATVVSSFKGVLQTNGTLACSFACSVAGSSYYIAIKHRNTVQTWSAAPVPLSSPTTNYDFTTAATKANGSNMLESETGIWVFYNGDINQDENIDLLDYPTMDFGIVTGLFGYYESDLNGDGNVDILDFPVLDSGINSGIFSVHP